MKLYRDPEIMRAFTQLMNMYNVKRLTVTVICRCVHVIIIVLWGEVSYINECMCMCLNGDDEHDGS